MGLPSFWARIRLGRAFRDLDRELDEELEDHYARVVEHGLRQGLDLPAAVKEGRRSLRRVRAAEGRIRREDHIRTVRMWAEAMLPRLLGPATEAVRTLRRRPTRYVRRVVLYALGLTALGAMWALTAPVRDWAPRSETEVLKLDVLARFEWDGRVGTAVWERDWVSALLGHPDLKGAAVAWAVRDMELASAGERHPVRVRFTTSDYFEVLGARPASGRLLQPADARRSVVPVVASHTFVRRFGRDVVGARLELDGVPVEIVGVAERGFLGGAPRGFDLAVPADATSSVLDAKLARGNPAWAGHLSFTFRVDRLRAARARELVLEALEEEDGLKEVSVTPRPWYGSAFSPSVYHSRGAMLLLVVAAMTYLLTLLNGWTLETAIRARNGLGSVVRCALGASRGQLLIREVFVGVVVGAAAGAVAFLPAQWLAEWIRAAVLDRAVGEHALGGGVALFQFVMGLGAVTGGVAVLSGRIARPAESGLPGQAATNRTLHRDEPWLVAGLVAQVAMVVLLGLAVALLGRAAWVGARLDMGLDTDRLWVVQFHLPSGGEPQVEVLRSARQAVQGLDGVEAAVWSTAPPFGFLRRRIAEVSGPSVSDTVATQYDVVSPGFFDALGTPLVSGSEPDPGPGSAQVVANQAFVDRYLGGTAPEDVCLQFRGTDGRDGKCQTISGITRGHVDDLRMGSVEKIYFLQEGPPSRRASLILRTAEGRTAQEQRALREAVSRAGGSGLNARWTSLQEASRRDLEPLILLLEAGLAGLLLALGVALAGLTAVISLLTARRETDFAVRLALGARPLDLLREGLGRLLRWLVMGAMTAVLAFPLIESLLELQFTDGSRTEHVWKVLPVVLVVTMGLGIGALLPVWRATRISPSSVLREGD